MQKLYQISHVIMCLKMPKLCQPSGYSLLKNFKPCCLISQKRTFASKDSTNLREVLDSLIPEKRELIKKIKSCLGDTVIGDIKINNLYGGMRGLHLLIYDTSFVSPTEGVQFRGKSLEDCQKCLVKAKDSCEILPESLFWLLVTGIPPTEEQTKCLSQEWRSRANLPKHVVTLLREMPPNMHPMAQLSAAVLALSTEGQFTKKYAEGLKKKDYWIYIYEDVMNVIANVPLISAHIYVNNFRKGKGEENICISDLDWAANFSRMIGFDNPICYEMMRMILSIHCDNEGGNVSAHTVQLVGSALSSAYLSYSAGINGLAGPLHGMANQDVLIWINNMKKEIGDTPSKDDIGKYVEKILKSGQVVPGYGHAVLRATDNRFNALANFGKKHLPDDPLLKLALDMYEVVPPILKATGKVSNPWPNVDALSGTILQHFGLKEMNFYTVIFAISRCLGTMAALIWARALGYPIERPKSMLTEHCIKLGIEKMVQSGKNKK